MKQRGESRVLPLRKPACFHPATNILVIAVSPYIAASEMWVHVSSLHKCNQQIFLPCSFFSRRFCSRAANLSSGVDASYRRVSRA